MLDVREGSDPLLRRPLGIMDAEPPLIRVYFQLTGRGTRILAQRRPGDHVQVLGPLGNPFPDRSGRRILAVAGGRGIAPLFFALKRYARANEASLLYGARSDADLHLRDRIERLGLKSVAYCTESGDYGRPGRVTDALQEMLTSSQADMTIACGPHAMLAALAAVLEDTTTEDYMSAEALMGCGIGACHSCAITASGGGYLRVCQDGPVFSREEIQWRT